MQWVTPLGRNVNDDASPPQRPTMTVNTSSGIGWITPLPSLVNAVTDAHKKEELPPSAKLSSEMFGSLGLRITTLASGDGVKVAEFVGPLNISHMPQAGKLKVTPGPVSHEDITRVEHLVESGATGTATSLSNLRRYNDFKSLNPQLQSHALALMAFGAQQSRQGGLDPGSARNLVSDVFETLKQSGERIGECPLLNRLLNGLKTEKAQKGASPALDITEEEAIQYMRNIKKRIDVRTVIWLMLTCGARVQDLLHVEKLDQFLLDLVNKQLYIEFRVTKQRRSITDVFKAYFPFYVEPDEEVIDKLTNTCLSQLPDCDSVNKVLKKVCPANMNYTSHPYPTTYSFRRLFDHRVIDWYTGGDGIVEWSKVIEWTTHKEVRALRGHYAKATVLKLPPCASKADPVQESPAIPVIDELSFNGITKKGTIEDLFRKRLRSETQKASDE